MLAARQLVHAPIDDIPSGGECIFGGKGSHSPQAIVKSWMGSSGHKGLILAPNIRSHAVAISEGKHETYATWRGSYEAVRTSSKATKHPNRRNRVWALVSRFFAG